MTDILDEYETLPDLILAGNCQAITRAGKRCPYRAEVQDDGTAYCAIHAPDLVGAE